MARVFKCDKCQAEIDLMDMAEVDVRTAGEFVSEKYHLCIDCWAGVKAKSNICGNGGKPQEAKK